MKTLLPDLTFVLGGAASGKSAFAEGLVHRTGLSMVYLATAQAYDAEMRAKIDLHQSRRGPKWTTRECPLDLAPALAALTPAQICLIDCATLWLSNHLLADHDIPAAQSSLLNALATCAAPVVIVSNEVGQGIVPDNAMSRSFREAQGRLNIALAARADLVVQVTAGLPNVLKGTLP